MSEGIVAALLQAAVSQAIRTTGNHFTGIARL
jgi:hypothetical protein